MFKNIKKLFRRDKNKIEDLNDGVYIKDSSGNVHYIVINSIHIEEDGQLGISYKSSSDLESRGLMPHLQDLVMKRYFGKGD